MAQGAKNILKAFQAKNTPAATALVHQALQEKLTERLAEERLRVSAKLVLESACNVCGNPNAVYSVTRLQSLCKSCEKGTPVKVARSVFDREYWKGDTSVPDSTKREFYSDYLASKHNLKDYIAATTQHEDHGTIVNAPEGGVYLRVVGSDGKPADFWYKSRQSALEYAKSAQITLKEDAKIVTLVESAAMPANWDKGFQYPYRIGGGGKETPFIKNGKWYLYVYNQKTGKHEYYSYSDDIYLNSLDENVTKKAIIREPGHPIGQSAPLYLICVCGEKVYVPLLYTDQATFACEKCKQKYNRKGYLVESDMPTAEVQRVYDETGDVGETELLCGIKNLKVSPSGDVISFISEGYRLYFAGRSGSVTIDTLIDLGKKHGVDVSTLERLERSGTKYSGEDFDAMSHVSRELAKKGVRVIDLLGESTQDGFAVGDRVKYSDRALNKDRETALNLGRSHPRFASYWAALEKRAAEQGTVTEVGKTGLSRWYRVKWDNGATSQTLDYMLMSAGTQRLNGL